MDLYHVTVDLYHVPVRSSCKEQSVHSRTNVNKLFCMLHWSQHKPQDRSAQWDRIRTDLGSVSAWGTNVGTRPLTSLMTRRNSWQAQNTLQKRQPGRLKQTHKHFKQKPYRENVQVCLRSRSTFFWQACALVSKIVAIFTPLLPSKSPSNKRNSVSTSC